MSSVYTVYGNSDLDNQIDSDMKLIVRTALETLPEKDVTAIILGGGYGRGQGGVGFKNGNMTLYNDYDMFMVTNNISRNQKSEYLKKIMHACENLKDKIDIDVDFGPLKNINELENIPRTIMYYELKKGHKVIYGDRHILDKLPEYDIGTLPEEEALNYMLNRGVGLLLASKRLSIKNKNLEDKEFIERNIYKAIMACGDIFLLFENSYSYSYTERLEAMKTFKNNDVIRENGFYQYYKDSINYKLKPVNQFELLQDKFNYALKAFENFYLYSFAKYWNTSITSPEDYYSLLYDKGISSCKKFKDLPKNLLLNTKIIGLKKFSLKFYLSYPRYRLFFVLPHLLFNFEINDEIYSKALSIDAKASIEEKIKKYLALWNRFN